MGRMTIDLPDDLEKQLRHLVIDKYGGKKGTLGEAIREAVQLWINSSKKQ